MKRSMIPALMMVAVALGCGEPILIQPSLDGVTEEETERAVTGAALPVESSDGCHPVGGLVRTFAVSHLHDEALQQQAGPLVYVNLDRTNRVPGTRFSTGTIVATITGFAADQTLRVNHHLLMGQGSLRTANDVVALTPTEDPCLFDLAAELFIADGSGAFAGASGEGAAAGTLDFCTGRGSLVWAARVCFE